MINEIERLISLEAELGIKLPFPKFFYIQRYGRRPEDEMERILSRIGRKEWFLFQINPEWKDKEMTEHFLLELEKHARVGKTYGGCVLIEFPEAIDMGEQLKPFFEYLKSQEENFDVLFTMKQSKNTVSVQQCMEQYFFVRTICAEEYSVEEQLGVIRNICEEYCFQLDSKAVEILMEGLKRKEWRIEERTVNSLRNKTCGMLYQAVMQEGVKEQFVTEEMALHMLEHMEKGISKKITFGFDRGGISYE